MSAHANTRAVFLLMVIVCVAGICGSCQPSLAEMWALFEITGLPDGSAEGLRVFAQGGSFGVVEIEIAPPGADGRTYFPYWGPWRTWRSTQVLDPAHLRIVTAAKTIELDLPLQDGAVAERDGASVRVVAADAAPPPAPTITVVPGSSPAVFGIDGYIRDFEICDCSDGRAVWGIGTETVAGAYIHSIELGAVPAGWTFSGPYQLSVPDGEEFDCRRDKPCTGGLRPMGLLPFSNEVIVGEAYCVDADGAVVSCSEADAAQAR